MRKTILLTLAFCLVMGVGLVWAGVDGSNHDITVRYPALDAKEGACSFCHVPHGAQGDKLFPSALVATGIPAGGWLDTIALICWDCHSGSSPYVEAREVNPFQNNVHMAQVNSLVTWGDVAALSGSVYDVAGGTISCASCHNPHDNAQRPFLRDNGIGRGIQEGEIISLCDDCHTRRADPDANGLRTNHPMATGLADTALADINAFATMWTGYKNDYFTTGDSGFAEIISLSPGLRYNAGGKVWASVASTQDNFDCGTCHAVHNNETDTGWGSNDGHNTVTTAVAPNGNAITVTNDRPNVAAGSEAVALICSGCHTTTGSKGPGISGSSHAYEATVATPAAPFVVPSAKTGAGLLGVDSTAGYSLISDVLACQDCHDIHFAPVPATAGTNPQYALIRNECADCHATSAGTVAGHHPVGIVTIGTDTEEDALGNVPILNDVNWTTADVGNDSVTATTLGYSFYFQDVAGSTAMTCGTCHGSGNARAHNNTAGGGTTFPILSGPNEESQMCVGCHGVNPSDNSPTYAQATTRLASHMVGGMADSGYYWFNETVTPAALVASKYGTDSPANDLICESCHTLKISGVTFQASDNNGSGEIPASVPLLLTNSGNDDATAQSDDLTTYLCTACHGAAPRKGGSGGTAGATHPTIHAGALMPVVSGIVSAGITSWGGVSETSNQRINCESCHRPHDAATMVGSTLGATLILEYIDTLGTNLNEAVLCAKCHTDKY